MRKIVLLVIPISFLLAIIGSYFIIHQPSDQRVKYQEIILQKAKDIKKNIDKKINKLKSPDQPDMAAFQEYIMTVDPSTGEVPKDRLQQAYNQTRKLQADLKSSSNISNLMEWQSTGANMGGRTRAVMFDPNDINNKKVWAGGVTGGLWYTNDITNTSDNWVPVGDFWSNIAISCMTYDPNNSQTFYVGTGEAQTARIIYRASSGIGVGIYKTNDAGLTWEIIETSENFDYITDIAVKDENGTSVIYACVASGIYMGEDHQSVPSDGVFRSDDGGATWEQVLPMIPGTISNKPYTPSDIEIASNGRIFVGTMENLDKQGGATVLYSDSGMPGSWITYDYYNDLISNEATYNIPARTLVATSHTDPDVVYAQFAAGYTSGFVYYRGRYMASSADGGINWSQINKPNNDWATLAWHAFVLKVDPSNPNTLYTGGLDLYKSSNGGMSWNQISDWILMYYGGGEEYVHADQHSIQFQPGSNSTAVFSSDGGVFLTNTANYSQPVFIERNQGYNTLQFYSCCIRPTPFPQQFIGGLQDNGTLLYSGQAFDIGDMIDGGDGAYCFWDKDEPNIYITSVYYNDYTSWNNGNQADFFDGNSGTFISPADYDYKENILYSNAVDFFGENSNKLFKASNIPFNVNTQLIDIGTGINVPFSHITYSEYSPIGTSTLFVGSQAGTLYKVTNAQSNPETTEIGSSDFPTANISCVAVGEDEDNLLVTFSNYGVSSVWHTTDGGTTWEEKEANLPDMPIRWAIFHPDNSGQAILATEIGIWWTNTLNESNTYWTPSVEGMANVRVDMLKLRSSDNKVLAATHGRGLFTADYEENPFYVGTEENQNNDSKLRIHPNPAIDNITISTNLPVEGKVMINITDLGGKIVHNENIENQTGNLKCRIKLPYLTGGIYFVTIFYDGGSESAKLIVN